MKKSCYAYLITNEIVHKIPLPTLRMLSHWHFLSVEGCITHPNGRSEKRFHLCSGCLRKSFGGEDARGSLPVAALLLMCSSAATRTGRLEKAIVESLVTSGSTVMILPSAESKLCSRQSDTSRWTCGMTPHSGMGTGRQRAEAVAQGKASATAQMAAKNPTLWPRSHNTGNVISSPITADQQPPQAGLWGSRKWSEGPWLSAL